VNSFVWNLGLFIGKINHPYSYSILIIRTDHIGDYVLFTPALKYLRNKYRDMNISLLLQDTVSDLAYDNPYIDDIITFNKKKYQLNIFYKLKLLWRIRIRNYKIVLNAVYSRDIISDEVALWSCGEEKIGWNTIMPNLYSDEKVRGDRIYTHFLSSKNIDTNTHELQINLEFIKLLGIDAQNIVPELFISKVQKEEAQQLIAGIYSSKSILIGLITEANDTSREWSHNKYCQLVNLICNEFKNATFMLIGTNNKKPLKVNDNCSVVDLRGKTSLYNLPAILAKCALVIGNESGPIHIANAVGAPSISIMGGGHFNRFVPYPDDDIYKNMITPIFHKMDCFKCGWNCIYERKNSTSFPCIDAISVDEVYNAVKNILNLSAKE
jgi:ADP-heptose:LPS heptosyltransferase